MPTTHIELLVEEPSMEAFLRSLLPRLIPENRTFQVHPFQGKADLLARLEARLRGYAAWLPPEWRIVVVVDRDDDDCNDLKQKLEEIAASAALSTRSKAQNAAWQLVNRIAIEELESWYFGDWEAVCGAYPRAPANLTNRQGFRDPDEILGGTWEAFERVMQKHGYFKGGLKKIEVARVLGARVDPARNSSRSFVSFWRVIEEAFDM